MKLFAWQPQGAGSLSFFVMAEDEAAARAAVDAHIAEGLKKQSIAEGRLDPYDIDGWGTDYYGLTVVEPGVVVMNNND